MRFLAPLVLAVILAALPGTDAVAAKDLGTCDGLRGRAVVTTDTVRVVSRKVRQIPRRLKRGDVKVAFIGRKLYGCTLPAGEVRMLGRDGTNFLYRKKRPHRVGTHSASATSFGDTAGRYVYRESHDGSERFTVHHGEVVNLETGAEYSVYLYEDLGDGPEGGELSLEAPDAFRLSDTGVAAAVFPDPRATPEERTVHGFTADGTQHVLDRAPEADIDPASLALAGTTVSWVTAGTARSADLSTLR